MLINNAGNGNNISEQYTNQGATISTPKVNMPKSANQSVENVKEKELIHAIEKANQIQTGTTEAQFSVHEETKQIMIKLVDSSTKEVVKELPSEKILDMVAHMSKLAGLFVDEKR